MFFILFTRYFESMLAGSDIVIESKFVAILKY